ncbi:hypothetical protein KNA70_003298 [Salmonella enterica]|nr:hypothetical protein [Salmonella enterica]ELS6498809.1 hypothetical protein [Salmonella enterica]
MSVAVVIFRPFDYPEETHDNANLHHSSHQHTEIHFKLAVVLQMVFGSMILVKQICSECPQAGIALYQFVDMVVQE